MHNGVGEGGREKNRSEKCFVLELLFVVFRLVLIVFSILFCLAFVVVD